MNYTKKRYKIKQVNYVNSINNIPTFSGKKKLSYNKKQKKSYMNKLENMLRYYGKQISKYIEKNFKK